MEISAEKTKLLDKHRQWHRHRDLSKWTEAWDSHKLQVPRLNCNWWEFQARDTFQDSTDNSSIDKVETTLEWQEHFSQFQDMTDVLPCHIHFPVCLWIMDPHSRAPKKNTSHENEVLPQDTTHLIQRPCYQRGCPYQDPAGNWTTKDLLTIVKRRKLQWYGHVSRSSGLAKTFLQGTMKGGRRQGRQRNRREDNTRELTGLEFGKSQRAVENREKWRKLVAKSSVVPQRPSRLRDRWDDDEISERDKTAQNND